MSQYLYSRINFSRTKRRGWLGSFEEIWDQFLKEAARKEAQISAERKRVTVFLLGPGFPHSELDRRRALRDELKRLGINAIVMEDLPAWNKGNLSNKFRDIIEKFKPDLYVAIFTRLGRSLGITFELGFLTALLGTDELKRRLRYCLETRLDASKVMSAYVREQLPMTTVQVFRDDSGLLRAVVNFVDNYTLS